MFIDDFNVFVWRSEKKKTREKVSGRKKNRLKIEIIQSFIFQKYYFKKKKRKKRCKKFRNEILANRFFKYLLNTINRLDLETMNISCTEIKLRLFISETTSINSAVILLISILCRFTGRKHQRKQLFTTIYQPSPCLNTSSPLLKHAHVSRNENGKQTNACNARSSSSAEFSYPGLSRVKKGGGRTKIGDERCVG